MSKKISSESFHHVDNLEEKIKENSKSPYSQEELDMMQKSLSLLEDMSKERPVNSLHNFVIENYGVNKEDVELLEKAEILSQNKFKAVDEITQFNQMRLTKIFQEAGVTDYHLGGSNGYGYGDVGRDKLEEVFARYFGGEAALVRPQIISGTHAIACGLFGNLKPGDELLSACGTPYDTMLKVIGVKGNVEGSLTDMGVKYTQAELCENGLPNYENIENAITKNTKVVLIQRSKGYSFRPSLGIDEVEMVISTVKDINPDIICVVDNCYCEMADTTEPGMVGADLVIGSLIKSVGGTLAPCGGYIVGKKELVHKAAIRLLAPGLGEDMGATLNFNRLTFQGMYQAPVLVGEAIKGMILASTVFETLGYKCEPAKDDTHVDMVQAVEVGSEKKLAAFCLGIQMAAPLNATFTPETDMLPGYDHPVIMAGGSFVQGSSSELSADGPVREPFIVYMQGGIGLGQIKLGILLALKELKNTND